MKCTSVVRLLVLVLAATDFGALLARHHAAVPGPPAEGGHLGGHLGRAERGRGADEELPSQDRPAPRAQDHVGQPGPRLRRGGRRLGRGRGRARGRGAKRARQRLSRNITLVLENLLKNYENSRPPRTGNGQPAVVRTNILIRSMGPVSELGMDYSMDCYFRQYWRDARLSFKGPIKSLSLSIKMLERIWRPDTYFYNGKQSYVHTITVPNKLLRLSSNGDIIYSMRLTIKATCPMELRNFPMDTQSCPLIIGSYAYPLHSVVYEWLGGPGGVSVDFVPGMALSQFDLMAAPHRNFTISRRDGNFSILQVNFNLRRNTGYFLIQVYVPCILIVVLSWVSFWIHREATSDRVGLGITTVLTLSTISLDSRKDLPKVRHATALDWFLLMSFLYCIATLLQFAAVHYFTKVGSGEIYVDEEEQEDGSSARTASRGLSRAPRRAAAALGPAIASALGPALSGAGPSSRHQRRALAFTSSSSSRSPPVARPVARWRQAALCLAGDESFRRQRERVALQEHHHINSVSGIDRAARVLFPASFIFLNLAYWVAYAERDFSQGDATAVLYLDH
ncbi:gamma-aminobutyric acid receptor alpha-like isoform X2 [Frankliniella occidentalis]|uniref:Gamma-aminobutyric acid receptor alpha-like isoform X2 n=1 Tax=Frankliniella occidentalis TaxID=133901 RepID=A0A9C6TU17_FRAOC|nr:gamma-aminobutyric acid receptor alpha-like isoform X2 [Frankliniella occidentalis]